MFTEIRHLMPIRPITPLSQLDADTQTEVSGTNLPFKDIFGTAVQNLRETDNIASNNAALLALGDVDDLHTLGIDSTRAALAAQIVVELRNRAMEIHSELMRINL